MAKRVLLLSHLLRHQVPPPASAVGPLVVPSHGADGAVLLPVLCPHPVVVRRRVTVPLSRRYFSTRGGGHPQQLRGNHVDILTVVRLLNGAPGTLHFGLEPASERFSPLSPFQAE